MSRRPSTAWSLAAALFAGLLVGAGPHTSSGRLLPSVVGGLGVAAGAFALLRHRAVEREPLFARPPRVMWVVLAVFLVAFAPTIRFLLHDWTDSIWQNAHGMFLPLALPWLGLRLLRRDPSREAESSAAGLVLLAVGLALATYDAYVGIGHLGALGLVICLWGLVLLLLGARRARLLLPVLVLSFFVVPFPTSASYAIGLPQASAALTEWFVELGGITVLRQQAILTTSTLAFAISDRCAGSSALYGGMALAIFLAFHARSRWRRLLLLLAPWPLVVVSNGVRLAALMLASPHMELDLLAAATHGLSGIFAFWSVVVGLLLLADWRQLREALA